MTENEARTLRDTLKAMGVSCWTEEVVPNRHGFAVCYSGVSRPRDTVTTIGTRVVLTPEEGDGLLAEIRSGDGPL